MISLYSSLVALTLAATALAGPSTEAVDETMAGAEHCVIEVIDQLETGELIMSDPACFETFAAAMANASRGSVRVDPGTRGAEVFADASLSAALSTFTIGIHYDGYSGSGSSITVVGSACNGGYWNTPAAWDNRISSSWNGCHRLAHYDGPNKTGSYGSTWGTGSVHNVPSYINNKAESIRYSSS